MSWRSIGRKWKKLRRSPWQFLADSRNPGLRAISKLLQTLLPGSYGALGGLRRHPRFDPSFYSQGKRLASGQNIEGWSVEHDLTQLLITIVVVVAEPAAEVRPCLESILAQSQLPGVELLLIDDAATAPATRRLLEEFAAMPRVTLLRNAEPLGVVRSLNRGLMQAEGRDVVHLRSDVLLGPGWLRALAAVAYSSERVASASARVEAAGKLEMISSAQDAARSRARSAAQQAERVTNAESGCVYLRRDALSAVGLLDEAVEQADAAERAWSQRARDLGFQHLIALAAYARAGRLEATETDRRGAPRRPRLMFVVSMLSGGTPHTNEDLMHGVAALYDPLLLICDARELRLFDCAAAFAQLLARHELAEVVPFSPHVSAEYDRVVSAWLLRFGVELVHVRHIAWHSLGLVTAARRLGIPTLFSFHDFYTMCPSVNLTDGALPAALDGVVSPHILAPLWERRRDDDTSLASALAGDPATFLAGWKGRMNAMLSACDAFVTTSPSVQAILTRNLPVLRERAADFHIIPHGRDFARFLAPKGAPRAERPLRVLLPGNISETKGLTTVLELLRLDVDRSIELHTLGRCPPQLHAARATHHGRYARDEMLARIEAIAPDVALIPTTAPETFCHTLTECWAAGLPVIGSELGALGERIRQVGAGFCVDPRDARGILELLLRIRSGQEDWSAQVAALTIWQRGSGASDTVSAMAERYIDVYQELAQRRRSLLPSAGRRAAGLPRRIALVSQGTFPSCIPSAHIRIGNAVAYAAEVHDYAWLDGAELVRQGVRDFDGVIVCRNGSQEPSVLGQVARHCRKHGVPLLLDLDDDLLNVPAEKDPGGAFVQARPALRQLLDVASLLTVSTAPLAEAYAPLTRAVRVVPNRLDARVWLDGSREPVAPPARLDRDAVVRVLYMGTPSHQEDLELILAAFARLRREHGVQLHTIGVLPPPVPRGVVGIKPPGARYDRFIRWLRSVAPHFEIAVAPLVDTPFNRAKSDLKFLEYAACGLPVVASRIGPYAASVRHGEDGLLTSNDEQSWFSAVESLVVQPELRARLGRAARQRAMSELMSTTCVFDDLPWADWNAQPAAGSAAF